MFCLSEYKLKTKVQNKYLIYAYFNHTTIDRG